MPSQEGPVDSIPAPPPATSVPSGSDLSLDAFDSFTPPEPSSQPSPAAPQPDVETPPTNRDEHGRFTSKSEAAPQDAEGEQKEEKPLVEEEIKTEQPTAQPKPKTPFIPKDYSGLTPEEIKHAKQMSNTAAHAYVNTVKQLRRVEGELKEIKSKPANPDALPASYYEHPQGYTLSKEYPSLVANYRNLDFEERHWEQQLINIEGGQDWQDIEYDKEGNPHPTAPLKASPQAKVQVNKWMYNAGAMKREITGKIQGLQETHKKFHSEVQNKIKTFSNAQGLDFLDDDKQPGNKIFKEAMSIIEKDGLGGNVLAPITAKLWALARLQQDAMKADMQQRNAANKNASDAKRAQPTAGVFDGATKRVEKMLDLKDFEV